MRHRVREQLVGQRTAVLNALRGHLGEIGVIAPQGAQHAYRLKRFAAGGPTRTARSSLPNAFAWRWRRCRQIDALDEAIVAIDKRACASAKADETARRLMTIPGIGPVTASAIVATVHDVERFRQRARVRRLPRPDAAPAFERRQGAARDGSARWATATCASSSSWAPPRRSATAGHDDALRRWAKATARSARRALKYAFKLTAVALANKLARIVFALLTFGRGLRRPACRGLTAAKRLGKKVFAARRAGSRAPTK